MLAAGALLTTAACADEDEAQFGSAKVMERDLAIGIASGFVDSVSLLVFAFSRLGDEIGSQSCPEVIKSDERIELIGDGCTTSDGKVVNGRIVQVGSDGSTGAIEIQFLGYESDGLALDGTYQFSEVRASRRVQNVELRVELDEVALEYSAEADCLWENQTFGACTRRGAGEVEGLGSFSFTAETKAGESSIEGWAELTAQDTLRVDFDATVDDCAPVTIDGAMSEAFCVDEEDLDGSTSAP